MRWGLPPPPLDPQRRTDKPQHNLFLRDLRRDEPALLGREHRCIIILDSFALPDGPAGARTRTWYGYDDRPLFGWAGVWREGIDYRGFAGFLVGTLPEIEQRQTLPVIVEPDEYDNWLRDANGPAIGIASRLQSCQGLYCEPTEQPWGADRTPG